MKSILLTCVILIMGCNTEAGTHHQETPILPGAYQTEDYVPHLRDKSVGVVVNHTSMIHSTHLVDSLLSLGIDVQAIFAPEHGFKGLADAGQHLEDDIYMGRIPIYSLYGQNRKPGQETLTGLDVMVFDIQDVGVRFYTYLSTLHLIMEAAAEANVPVVVLDRPNPNIHYVDGPIMDEKFFSFVGMHPVPTVYGMTIGEYAQMINGEGWLANGVSGELHIVVCKTYTRADR